MRLIASLLLSCLCLLALPSQAETLGGLYRVSEPVQGQQAEARDAALQAALATLIQRLTGDPKAADASSLSALRADPQQLVVQYGYENDRLVVEFDPQATARALREAGLGLWGANRPSLLVWWLAEDTEGSNLVADGQPSAQPLRDAAQHRGLALRLPLADLQEQLAATPDALANLAGLENLAGRYAADGQLGVYARQQDDGWRARWTLQLADTREQGEASGATPQALADSVFATVIERLAPHYRVTAGQSGPLRVEIDGANLARYAQVQQLLEPFAAQLEAVDGDSLVFRVSASSEQLRAQLALARLRELPVEAAPAPQPAPVDGAPVEPQAAPQSPADLRFGW